MALAGPPRSHENKLPPRLFITPGLHSPGPMPQSDSYVHQDHEPANLYIRNIIPIRAPAGLSRVQSKPLPGRARTPHPPARPDLFSPNVGVPVFCEVELPLYGVLGSSPAGVAPSLRRVASAWRGSRRAPPPRPG